MPTEIQLEILEGMVGRGHLLTGHLDIGHQDFPVLVLQEKPPLRIRLPVIGSKGSHEDTSRQNP